MILSEKADGSDFQTCGENLIRYKSSGTYFMRCRVAGKLHVRSLKTKVMSVAKQRLADEVQKLRIHAASVAAVGEGKMRFRDAVTIYQERLSGRLNIKPRTKQYYRETIAALLNSWPGLAECDVKKISQRQCQDWALRFFSKYSGHRANNTLAVLRNILDIAVESGACYANPAKSLKRTKVRQKSLSLPTREQFLSFVTHIQTAGGRASRDCADYVRFLAFSGCRKSEAAHVEWQDVDFQKNDIIIRGDPSTGTKNWEVRRLPMIHDLRLLLQSMRMQRSDEPATNKVLKIQEAQKSIDRAAKLAGMQRITHHDLRHLFATTCIESGIDIPTVARLLGHKDGGALCMRVYGHLRDDHARASVAKVHFSTPTHAAKAIVYNETEAA